MLKTTNKKIRKLEKIDNILHSLFDESNTLIDIISIEDTISTINSLIVDEILKLNDNNEN